MKYSDAVVTYTNDTSKEKYIGVIWATKQEERCPEYVSRLKLEFGERDRRDSQYEEVRCRRKDGHKGACLNNLKYSG